MKATITSNDKKLELDMEDPFDLGTLAVLLSEQINKKIYGLPNQEDHIDWIKTAIEQLYFVKEVVQEKMY
ncbi:hypothetical protein [Klebsiella pneumoniae]|uniref:hypothetical protein n=1 Tax=Klebsiella pneumoniae TaxID=573 RepID=UPI000E2D3AB8|nr:hypothetical protein [Klebsiella pneumoniae]MBV0520499.1 hypothetical protein [Klebsiella pneumoniae]MBV0536744.1 hypothetical protein [Klebsiella pneumoniae]SWF08101.1 Uncharacterised protein [Klebsiella pneumoniae]HCJ9430450.1 hypothetical protein [Klebsiella pneumoniae]